MAIVQSPMFISSRLMAAIRIGETATIHIEAANRTSDDRVRYHYIIEDKGKTIDEGTDLHSGCSADVDYRDAMETLLAFLDHAAESYRYKMTADVEESSFSADMQEWCYMMSGEIEGALYNVSEHEDEDIDS